MGAIFQDLLDRLLNGWKSSAVGLATILINFAQDHGVTLSDANKSTLVAKLSAYALGFWMLFWKDKPTDTTPSA